MQVDIIIFGQLAELIGSNSISLNDIADTDGLLIELKKKFPAILDSKYVIAVDKKMINKNTPLTNQSTVALLPPFSGG